jgi:hypothetical protein
MEMTAMEHKAFPVAGFEFMNQPATDKQKETIIKLAKAAHRWVADDGPWPDPFTRWDAARMIEALQNHDRR